MVSLREELREVEKLRSGLHAEIVSQESVPAHYERVTKFWKGGYGDEGRNSGEYEESEWVPEQLRIAHPDVQARESARSELGKFTTLLNGVVSDIRPE